LILNSGLEDMVGFRSLKANSSVTVSFTLNLF